MKKINNIEISNFKSIKHLKIDGCKKINVFVGMPNAGKSNILEAIGLVGSLDYRNPDIKKFVRFNEPNELFFEGNYSKSSNVLVDNNYDLEIILFPDCIYLKYKNIKTNDSKSVKYIQSEQSKKNTINFDEILKNEHSIKKYIFKDLGERKKVITENNHSSSLIYPFGMNLPEVVSSFPELRKRVNDLFKENGLKLLIEKGTSQLKIFREYQDGTVFTLPYNMIAETLQRLIFFKAAIMSNKSSILLFEEPEAHCFEPYILEFTNDVKNDENNNQFFIVTHSDYIIKEFLRDDESKESTNIYLVNNVNGETQVKLLGKDKNEDVYEYGMNVFFNFQSLWETN
ncbi:AAA family ATPase [Flavobacterium soyangense]|uniref:AAA family ATPase n=1 Tax=Flavobacterium soyangense TaxID=2023265 RepID=A0A930XUE5_9FLAO|nr:AAA family ATPase [Flavobacterium soyangense]MBF2707086.1 AAA family ATPase [Flavobacterium soyangense]